MKPNILALLNEQIGHELESAYVYLSMASYLEGQNLQGMGNWMRAQVHEETVHAMKILNHVLERGQPVKLRDVKQIKPEWGSVLEVWGETLKHEQFITSKIHDLMTASREAKDYATEILMQWYVSEQVEEEASAGQVLDQVRKAGESHGGLAMVDHRLRHRAPPEGSPFARTE